MQPKITKAKHWLFSCDFCDSQEGEHYLPLLVTSHEKHGSEDMRTLDEQKQHFRY
jgi:hypothetical protein